MNRKTRKSKTSEEPLTVRLEEKRKSKKDPKVTKVQKITLLEHQVPHVDKLEDILSENYCAFDMSSMGSGKTYTTSQIALNLDFKHVIVICPVSLESKWRSMKQYGVPIAQVISYQGLRSRKGSEPRHGLLTRHDIFNEGISSTFFTPTPYYNRLIEEGCLVVFDEVQNFKNKNDQFMACKALTTSILNSGGVSRFILLSGTPFDKEIHAVHMLEMMGFIRAHKLFNFVKEENKLKLLGAQELVDFCKSIDPEGLVNFLKYNAFTRDNVHHNCYLLFQRIIKKNLSATMPSPKVEKDVKNGYYVIEDEEDRNNLIKGILQLQTAAQYNEKDQSVKFSKVGAGIKSGFSAITKALESIEKSKINTMARLARSQLGKNPMCKVAIFLNFRDSIVRLKEYLVDFNPLVLDGSVLEKNRPGVIEKFQAASNDNRLILCNIAVAGIGIDLDDKFGNRPRFAFASPNYSILNLHQAVYRFARSDSKSICVFRFVYGITGRKEVSILSALSRKSAILKDTLELAVKEGEIFPGDLPDEFEKQ
jgi:SNF2 family DNA or RNA helicase